MRINILILLSITLLLTDSVFSQSPGLVFHQLTTKDGLSENTIRCIQEDRKGFMWFGTEDGLNRYDGYEFKQYKNSVKEELSISSGQTKSLFIDSKSNLWVATRDGLNLYDSKLDLFYNYKSNRYPVFQQLKGDIDMMVEDSKGNLWVSSTEDGLYKITSLDKLPERFISPFPGYSSMITCIAMKDDQTIFIGTLDGLFQFNTQTKKFIDLRNFYGKGYQVKNIYIERNNNQILLATTAGLKIILNNGGFIEYTNNPNNPEGIIGNNVTEVIKYKDGNYLLAIDGFGIDYFNPTTEKFTHYTSENQSQLSANNISGLFLDSKENLWVGTFMNGINFSNTTTNLFVLTKNNSSNSSSIKKGIITQFFKSSNGDFWITTDGGGIYRMKSGTDNFINYTKSTSPNSLTSNAVIGVTEDEKKNLYFTTYGGGLCQFDLATDIFINYTSDPLDSNTIQDNKLSAVYNTDDKLWIAGFGTGIAYLDKSTNKWTRLSHNDNNKKSLPSEWVHCFLKDKEGIFWVGTFNGLAKYNPKENNFINYTFGHDKLAQERNFILDIVEDSDGNFWLATSGAGLILFDRKKTTYKSFTTEEGLSNNTIKTLIEDNNKNLWLATNNGLTKFSIRDHKAKSYTLKDGVPATSFFIRSKYKDEDGKILFGSNNGYLTINPSLTFTNTYPPALVINKLKLFNEEVNPRSNRSPLKECIEETKNITLSYNQNSITIEFAALNYNNAQNNHYAYMLEGFDEDWVVSGTRRTATYTNLNPGHYTFRLKGANNDYVWNEKGLALDITITSPFYKTWWFYAIIVCSIGGIFYSLHKWRTRIIKQKNAELEEIVIRRTEELKNANEQLESFVYKASHDIKGPLRSIIGLTKIGQKDTVNEEAKEYFEHILKSTQKLDHLLMDLLEITKVKQARIHSEKIDFNEIILDALDRFENLPEYPFLKITQSIQMNGEYYSDRKLLLSIIQNMIENALKYRDQTKENNLLTIEINVDPHFCELKFTDNGIGIPKEFQDKIFDMFFKATQNPNSTGLGLYLVKTTVEKLHGTIQVESTPSIGTSFFIRLKNEINKDSLTTH